MRAGSRRRAVLGALGAGAAAAGVALAGACGGEPAAVADAGPPDASMADSTDVSLRPGDADAGASFDAAPDWWDCQKAPVECPDADYYVTVNGDGVERVLRHVRDGCGFWEPDGSYNPGARYHVPNAQAYGSAFFEVRGSELDECDNGFPSDGSAGMALFTFGGGDEVDYHVRDTVYDSQNTDAAPTVSYARLDPPGGLVAGSYSGLVKAGPAADAATLHLSGKFLACHICDQATPP